MHIIFKCIQLKFANALYGDFVVWNLVIQHVKPDEPFISIELEKCKRY